ncbi:hypothetical protein B0H66DRAFT_328836 [Apodospora peruviana]|uniref:Uncharacterized protein n=1 Tax=Apodospora peruviana TaxID=516989 RepID=A0AAE0M0V4_9PEZI|nr:hypothetical protein B0H66DRAFT_328836 [Apodospora peruviana]
MLLSNFHITHIPALLAATTTTLGGLWPIFSPQSSMLEFGFPAHIATSPAAHPVMVSASARTTVLGLLTWMYYLGGQYEVVDTILAVFGFYAGVVDGIVVWKTGNRGKAVFRVVGSGVIGVCGAVGLTAW